MDNSLDHIVANDPGIEERRSFSVGATLREAREHLGLSVTDVENRLKFVPRQIEALEADHYAELPEMSFVRRFVRSYARLLKLDPEPLLAALPVVPVQPSLHTTSIGIEMPFQGKSSKLSLKIIWLITVPALVVVFWMFFVWLNHREPIIFQPAVETVELPGIMMPPVSGGIAVSGARAPLAPPASAVQGTTVDARRIQESPPPVIQNMGEELGSVPEQSHSILLKFNERSWVKVTDHDGRVLLSRINSKGSEQSLKGRPPFSVEIGNARGVQLYYQGKPVELTPSNNGGSKRLTLE